MPWRRTSASSRSMQARENLRRHGIRACYFLQFGYLGEEWDDIEQTIQVMVRETRPHDIGVSVSYPDAQHAFPSDRRRRRSARRPTGAKAATWPCMYSGAFPTEFYRALADALHLEVRRRVRGCRSIGLGERWSSSDAPAADAWLLPPGGPQRAADHAALSAARGFSTSLLTCDLAGSKSTSTIPPWARARNCSASSTVNRPACWACTRNLLTRRNALAIMRPAAQACGWKVVVGGPEPANYAEEYLAGGRGLRGAGRGRDRAGDDFWRGCSAPEGVVYRDAAGKVVRTPPAAQIRDLTRCPGPIGSASTSTRT